MPTKTASTRSTTSRRSSAAPEPFTLEHFRRYTSLLILDSGAHWELEDFQAEIVSDIFAGYPEVWGLIPEGNAKTTLVAGVAIYHGDYMPSAFVPIGASSREQAEIMYRQAEGFVLRTKGLRERFKCQEGYRRIKCLRTGGRIQVYAADDRTADGVIPSLAILDELHRHRDLRLYRTWRGKLEKRGGQIIAISTAGEPESEFEETRARIRTQADDVTVTDCHTRAAAAEIVLHDWAIPDRTQADDFDVVAKANPLGQITPERLKRKRESPTMTDAHWLRFVCNIATRISGQAVLPEEWDRLAEEDLEPDLSARAYGWLDLGWKIDTTAMGVLVWESEERRVVTGVNVLEPPVDEGEIVSGLLDLQEQYGITQVVFDPSAGAQQMAQLLEKGTHPLQVERGTAPIEFIAHSQDNAPMSLAATRLDEAIRNGWLVHDGDPVLRKHVLNAVAHSLGGEKWRYDRPPDAKGEKRRKYPIDALTGLLMGHSIAVANPAASSVYEDRDLITL